MISTSVAEEGINITTCNYVVCFDFISLRTKSYVQRKGRARREKAEIFFFCAKEELTTLQEQEKQIIEMIKSQSYKNYIPESHENFCPMYNESYTSPIGAKITENSAKAILNQYISLLPGDLYWSPQVQFKVS